MSGSVWAVIRKKRGKGDCGAALVNRWPFSMAFVGSPLHLVGLSCREARRLMEETFLRPLRGPNSTKGSPGTYWVNLKTTVVALGHPSDSLTVLARFGADELSRFRHVALG